MNSWFLTYVYFASFIGFPGFVVISYCQRQLSKTTSNVTEGDK